MTRRRAPHGKKLLAVGIGAITLNLAGCPFVSGNLVACEEVDCFEDAGLSDEDAGETDNAGETGDAGT